MPRIRDEFLNCVVYLYPSGKDAEEGSGIGGTGFLAAVATEGLQRNFWFPYIVTNRHVIQQGNTTVRLATKAGEKEIIETEERDWIFHPDGDDLAVHLISVDPKNLRFHVVRRNEFLLRHDSMRLGVGPGDDVFVVGRFINHEGRQTNSPTARFGCIGQMPIEPIRVNGFNQECYLVEARSIGGYSGSPVFWHVPFAGGVHGSGLNTQPWGPFLLGVELGYIFDWTPVCNAAGEPINKFSPDAQQVQVNSGMMIVVPAWKLTELLNEDSILEKRKKIEDQVKAVEQVAKKTQ